MPALDGPEHSPIPLRRPLMKCADIHAVEVLLCPRNHSRWTAEGATVLLDHTHNASGSVLKGFEALSVHLEGLAVLHRQAGCNLDIVIRIERAKALACRGAALARRLHVVTIH
jgi:hypothetical protein